MTLKFRSLLALVACLALVLFVAACGDDDDEGSSSSSSSTTESAPADDKAIASNPDNAKVTVTVGSKNFTEQKVLGEVYAQALEAAGYKVRKELNLGDEKTALKSLKDGTISGYPEYTGTALLSFLEVKNEDVPKDPGEAFEQVKTGLSEDGITALEPTPFTSSNEVGVTKENAEKLGLTKISDLEGKSEDLTLYGSPECRQRLDCLLGLQQVYGLKFKKFTPVDIALRHKVLKEGQADLSIVFTTDPQNKREGFVLLEDDKGMFPPYNSTFLVKESFATKAGPDMAETIQKVNEGLTAEAMQELNARVDLDKQTPATAAKAYLSESGFTK